MPTNPVKDHPQATAVAGSGLSGVFMVWVLGHFGLDMGAEVGASVAAGFTFVLALIGRKGVKGIARTIWRGQE